VYEYDTVTGELTRITHGSPGEPLNVGGYSYDATPSRDGSEVYFDSSAPLTPNAPVPTGGMTNLYGYNTASGATAYVATVTIGLNGATPSGLDPYTTPSGEFLLFQASNVLGGPSGAAGTIQLYRYDRSDGSVLCVSCRPDGTTSQGSGSIDDGAALVRADDTAVQIPVNPMADNGDYVFFNSNDELVPQDTNGTGEVDGFTTNWTDVYEWEAQGRGDCTVSQGCVHLLSSGTGASASEFLGASADGSNAFIATHSQLVPQDVDARGDIYDVRIDGGFASASFAPCSGDGCQGGLSAPPSLPTAASVTFAGPGNASPGALTTTAGVKVLSRVVRGSRLILTVSVPGAGRITITGAGIRTARRSVSGAGTYRLMVSMTGKARKALKRKLKLKLGVGYTPASGQSSRATVALTVKA
jgi:hypothetical protein